MKYVGWGLQIVGALALLLVGFIAWQVFFGSAGTRNPEFVLNWTGVPKEHLRRTLYATEDQLPNGDYGAAYCIEIDVFEPTGLSASGWLHGADTNEILIEARRQAGNEGDIARCFGRAVDANSPELAAYVWSVRLHGRDRMEGADVILYDSQTRRLLYGGYQY